MVLDKPIQKQFQAHIMNFCSIGVDVRRAKMLDCEYQADVFICDEADELIENYAVIFHQSKTKNT